MCTYYLIPFPILKIICILIRHHLVFCFQPIALCHRRCTCCGAHHYFDTFCHPSFISTFCPHIFINHSKVSSYLARPVITSIPSIMSAPSRQSSPVPNNVPATNSSGAPPSIDVENIVAGLLSNPTFTQLISSAIAQSSSMLSSSSSVSAVTSNSNSTTMDNKESTHLYGHPTHGSQVLAQESLPSKNSSNHVSPSKTSSPSELSNEHPNSTTSFQVDMEQDNLKRSVTEEVAIPPPHFDDSIKGSNTCHNSSDSSSVPLQSHSAHWDGKISSTIRREWNPFDFPTPRVASDTRCELEGKDHSNSGALSGANVSESTTCESSRVPSENCPRLEASAHLPGSSTSKSSGALCDTPLDVDSNRPTSSRADYSKSNYHYPINDARVHCNEISLLSSCDDDSEIDDPTFTPDSDDESSILLFRSDLKNDSFDNIYEVPVNNDTAWQHPKTSSDDSSTAADMQSESLCYFIIELWTNNCQLFVKLTYFAIYFTFRNQ